MDESSSALGLQFKITFKYNGMCHFPTKMVKSGYCCGVETLLTFATNMSFLTCGHIHN
jgi:hypothetical protein